MSGPAAGNKNNKINELVVRRKVEKLTVLVGEWD